MPGYGNSSKDTRPVRDRAYQSECQRNIEDFLAHRGVQLALSSKWLVSPTQRDFQTLFRYLAEEIMGTGFPWSKKVEDDFIAILRDLKYPAMDNIGKTALTAPGGSNWPHVLAMLNWLVEICKVSAGDQRLQLTGRLKTLGTTTTSSQTRFFAHLTPCQSTTLRFRIGYCGISRLTCITTGSTTAPATSQRLSVNSKKAMVSMSPGWRLTSERVSAATVAECERLEVEAKQKSEELRQLQAQEVRSARQP